MREYILGFIGAGNMAQAIIKGAVAKGSVRSEKVFVYDVDEQKTAGLKQSCGVYIAESAQTLCDICDIVVLAVKPNIMPVVLEDIKNSVRDEALISIAAGWSADRIKNITGSKTKVLSIMPNTPLMAGEGMSVFESPSNLDKDAAAFVENVFKSIGKVEHVPAKLMDAVTAVSGSGPAYVYMFIEALSDAGVLCGLPRDMSATLATQTVLGAAKMVQDTGTHPGALKDAVCSPGGTTIEAVKSLEEDGFRGAVINAAKKCADKFNELTK